MKPSDLNARIRRVRLVIFDVDGVLTDGSIRLNAEGKEIKVFNVHDGVGIKYLQRCGIRAAILSGRSSPAVRRRAKELAISLVYQGYKRKLDGFERLLRRARARAERVCCVVDDLVDIPIMRRAGLTIAMADARPEVRRLAHWVSPLPGGRGGVREACEKILKVQGKWPRILESYGLRTGGPERRKK